MFSISVYPTHTLRFSTKKTWSSNTAQEDRQVGFHKQEAVSTKQLRSCYTWHRAAFLFRPQKGCSSPYQDKYRHPVTGILVGKRGTWGMYIVLSKFYQKLLTILEHRIQFSIYKCLCLRLKLWFLHCPWTDNTFSLSMSLCSHTANIRSLLFLDLFFHYKSVLIVPTSVPVQISKKTITDQLKHAPRWRGKQLVILTFPETGRISHLS